MVFVTGPRQVGKTFIARQIMQEFHKPVYLNHDVLNDRRIIQNSAWLPDADLIVFDEIHKMKNWKNFLKGVYDARSENQAILVTGSARMETYRQSGASLAGRYLHLRLNPLSVKELHSHFSPHEAVERLNDLGGFPEPFLTEMKSDVQTAREYAARWRNQYFTDLIREDILDFSRIQETKTMKLLVELLRSRVASPISYKSIAEDLQVAPNTVKKYIQILESLYIIFLVPPFHKNIARAILKEPKIYFYDSGYVKGGDGVRFENTCAVCLLKHVQFRHDAKGRNTHLNYVRTKDGKEVDFAIVEDDELEKLIEVKMSDNNPSPALALFAQRCPKAQALQLVHHLRQEEHRRGVDVLRAGDWLSGLLA